MAKRTCADCGKDKPHAGGRACEKGHFICKDCVWKGSGFFASHDQKRCPLDGTKLT